MSEDGVEDIYPLTPLQQGFLWHWLARTDAELGVEQVGLVLRGPLRMDVYARTWQQIVDRHPVLRTAFAWEDLDEALQIVYQRATLTVEEHDWRQKPLDERERLLEELGASERNRGFDIADPPLMRIAVVRLDDDTYDVTWTFHHLILDGWSALRAISEAHVLYNANCGEPTPELPPAPSFRDYFVWLQAQDRTEEQSFWQATLAGFSGSRALQIEGVERQPASGAGDARSHIWELSSSVTDSLRALARRHAVTLGSVIQAAWALVLSRYTGQDDIVFGTVVSGRPDDLPGITDMMGMFINNLPVRIRVDDRASLSTWLKAVHAHLIEARHYEHTPPAKIQEWANIPPRVALYDTLAIVQNNPVDPALALPLHGGVRITEGRGRVRTAYPLTLSVSYAGRVVGGIFIYEPRRFDDAAVERLSGHFKRLLEAMAAAPDADLDDLRMLSEEERQDLRARGERGYVLDAHHRLVPIGVVGQHYTEGGPGVTSPVAAAPSVPHPFSDAPGAVVTPTGQLAVHLPDGQLKVLGPPEQQVMVGGLRADLHEIEALLVQYPGVTAARVVVMNSSTTQPTAVGTQLLAYVVPASGTELSADDVRRFMRTVLPDQLVPSAFRIVRDLSAESIVDLRQSEDGAATLQSAAPRDGFEARLIDIWERVLGVQPIGIHDNFFDLGGTSFAAGRLLDRVQAAFERKLSLATLLYRPTVAGMAEALRGTEIPEGPVGILPINARGSLPPIFCAHGPFEYVLYYRYLSQSLGPDQPMYVLRWDLQDNDTLGFETVEQLAAAYITTMRTIQPNGPYYLLGHSFGGYVAYEMARQLTADGQSVGFLGLLDTGVGEVHQGRGVLMLAERAYRWLYLFQRLTPRERRAQFKERFRRTFTPRAADTSAAVAASTLGNRYRPGPYPGRVTLFWADYVPRPLGGMPDTREGWARLAAGGLDVHPVPGDHVLIVTEPRVHRLGKALKETLTRAQHESGSHVADDSRPTRPTEPVGGRPPRADM
jgi:thioesterase domain-containing protein